MKKWMAWEPEQIEYLKEHYLTESAGDIAEKLDKSKAAIWQMAHRLGLQKNERGGSNEKI